MTTSKPSGFYSSNQSREIKLKLFPLSPEQTLVFEGSARQPPTKSITEYLDNKDARLPNINGKKMEEQSERHCLQTEEKESSVENKKIKSNPYFRRYLDNRSSERVKSTQQNFLSIMQVRPAQRSERPDSKLSPAEAMKSTSTAVSRRILPELRLTDSETETKHKNKKRGISVEGKVIKNTQPTTHSIHKSSAETPLNNSGKKMVPVSKDPIRLLKNKKKTLMLQRSEAGRQSANYAEWCLLLGLLNGVLSAKEGFQTYKAFVGKGNNSVLVKNIIKHRPWWAICSVDTEVNLNWTQGRSKKCIDNLSKGQLIQNFEWQDQKTIKMNSYHNMGTILSEQTTPYVGIGFGKILSTKEKELFCPSSCSLNASYPKVFSKLQANKLQAHNHLEFNWNLSNKKALFYNLKAYYTVCQQDTFKNIPETHHITGQGDQGWLQFTATKRDGPWIVKPGQYTNRGFGIEVVATSEEVLDLIRSKKEGGKTRMRSYIVQKYIMPFLYYRRKFDIRCYMLVACGPAGMRGYWYEEGYLRTATKEFNTKNLKNKMIHLTNDAIQKNSESYGKHESANKLSFVEFQKYLKSTHPEKGFDFFQQVYPRMIQLAGDTLRSCHNLLDPNHREFSFEIFGLDFMVDSQFNTWLIEVNTNPCLELSCPLLARIVPAMLENAFRIAVDPFFPPPRDLQRQKQSAFEGSFQSNKFSLIFNSGDESCLPMAEQVQSLRDITESEQCDEQYEDQ